MKKVAAVLGLAYGIVFSLAIQAQQAPADGPRYVNGTNLVRPADYREWTFLAAGLGMTYEPASGAQSTAPQLFSYVFVNPSSYPTLLEVARQMGTVKPGF
jgi:hypothetical protein